jgi:membrane-bound lytic murein transglycosylase F
VKKENASSTKIKVNDLEAIMKRGTLRIIVPVNFDGGQYLPRFDSPVAQQQQMAQKFAKSLGLKAELVPVSTMSNRFSALLSGKGDIIASNITITEKRKEIVGFSAPIEHIQEVVLVNADNDTIKKAKDLTDKNLLIHPASSFWSSAKKLQKNNPTINLIKQTNIQQDEDALDLIADGEYDATIRDSNVAKMYLSFRDDLKVAFSLKGEKAIAWAIRPNAVDLKKALDQYLNQTQLSEVHSENQFGDLGEIRKRGVLRVLLRNNSSSYFFWRGQLMGFEYEMAQAYAKHLEVKLAVVVPPENALMLDWLSQGKADIAAGFLTPTKNWADQNILASIPYHKAAHHSEK